MTEWFLLLVGVGLTLGTAIFVAAEFSLVALDRSAVEQSVAQGAVKSKPVLGALRQLSTQLSACQIGITLTTLLVGFLAEPSLAVLLKTPLTELGISEKAQEPISLTSALILATAFSMLFGELLPKNLAISAPLGTAQFVAPIMRIFVLTTRPLIWTLNRNANGILRKVGVEPQEELSSARTPQELASLVRRSANAGTLGRGTAEFVTRSLGFADLTAADVMTPRLRCVVVHREASVAEVIRLARSTGHSRFPVVGENLDDIIGVVHLKRAVGVPLDRRDEVPAAALMSATTLVPETVGLDPLLVQLRQAGLQLAVVVDEYGGTSGVVTLEDVIEEIVGEVADEHDRGRLGGRKASDGTWTLPGLWRPDEARDRAGAHIPEAQAYETVGGFIMAALGRVPAVSDTVSLPGGQLTVTRMEGRRVDRIRWQPNPGTPSEPHTTPRNPR